MPFVEYAGLEPLADELVIWRYTNFAKFVSLLSMGRLLFVRADKHLSEAESAAMWSLYGEAEEALAIRSTIGQLKDSLQGEPEEVRCRKRTATPPRPTCQA